MFSSGSSQVTSCGLPWTGAPGCLQGPASQSLSSLQNTTVTRGNRTSVSDSMKDNPLMRYYASIYALSMAVMLILKAIRGVVFVKVRRSGPMPHLRSRATTQAASVWHLGVSRGLAAGWPPSERHSARDCMCFLPLGVDVLQICVLVKQEWNLPES